MNVFKEQQTIVAQCTPKGAGAIAVIRVSGADAFLIVDHIAQLSHKKSFTMAGSHTIHYGFIHNQERIVDQVLFSVMRSPKTFTGEDIVEISCHNNQFIIDQIITLLISHGARLAQAGEFSKRAVLNGKIDILQAEAINEVISASNEHALIQSLSQLQGSLSAQVTALEQQLIHALALSDASFEFLDEENIEFSKQILTTIDLAIERITQLLSMFEKQRYSRQGVRIACIGSVNAGKSSLFNALLQQNRSIVSSVAGTTRDTIEASLYIDGLYWTLIDTAGMRQTNDSIEKEGIERSREQAHQADIILLIFDASRHVSTEEIELYTEFYDRYQSRVIVVGNKIDIDNKNKIFDWNDIHYTSVFQPTTINELVTILKKRIQELFQTNNSPFLLNKRHAALLQDVYDKLIETKKLFNDFSVPYELVSIHIKHCIEVLSELTGKTINQRSMDAIFKEFCVGK